MAENETRSAGILLPLSALPSLYGIGTAGKGAYDFCDFLASAGQTRWQVLPLGPTGFGDSPYQSFSAFAGNPYYVDLTMLAEEGLLLSDELPDAREGETDVDYGRLYKERFSVLKLAAKRFDFSCGEYKRFEEENSFWLADYSLFMAIKDSLGGADISLWSEPLRARDKNALESERERLWESVLLYNFCQFEFFSQWSRLRGYAAERGIKIIGDIPIYVAADSADLFSHPEIFQLDEKRRPTSVAGVPPDYFSATGQLWGNPLYNWDALEKTDFDWWRKRIAHQSKLFDEIRIDHFIGIARYYSIKAGSETAVGGEFFDGPGEKLLRAINEAAKEAKIIAEDLGVLHEKAVKLLEASGYPGMRVLLFAGSNPDNPYLTYNFNRNSVVYVGTHDNATACGFTERLCGEQLDFFLKYYRIKTRGELPRALIAAALSSVCNRAVISMWDWLGKGDDCRFNEPSTIGKNWRWRMRAEELTPELGNEIREMTGLYGR